MLRLKYVLNFCIFVCFLLNSISSFAVIGKKEFQSVQQVSTYILLQYPRNEYIYIGIGRSPVPVMAYLQTEDETLVRNIPLTGFRYGEVSTSPQLCLDEEKRLYQHFDQFLPTHSDLNGRKKALIIDFSFTGRSISAAKKYFKKYIKNHRNFLEEVQGLAICMEENEEEIQRNYQDLDVFALYGRSLIFKDPVHCDHFLMMMAARMYLDQAEFESFDIKNPKALKSRIEYQEYLKEMELAKLNFRLGLLNDDWTNAVFEVSRNYEKYVLEINSLLQSSDSSSDIDPIRIGKEWLLQLVAKRKIEEQKDQSSE